MTQQDDSIRAYNSAQGLRKFFRDANGHVFVNIDDKELYRSTDDGKTYHLLATAGQFGWAMDRNGRVHVTWTTEEHTYPASEPSTTRD